MSQSEKLKKAQTESAAADEPSPMPTPSPTFYSELANTLIAALDQFTASVPDFDNPGVTRDFVAKKRRVPPEFVSDAISAVIVNTELQNVKALNSMEAIDDKQYVDAFKPLARHLDTALKGLLFSIGAREARLVANAQMIYAVAKAFSRERDTGSLGVHVANMKRALRAPRRRRAADVTGPAGKEDIATTRNASTRTCSSRSRTVACATTRPCLTLGPLQPRKETCVLISLQHSLCTVIPDYMLKHVAAHGDARAREAAATAMDLRLPVAVALMLQPAQDAGAFATRRVRRVFDAGNRELLPGKLVLEERRPDLTSDVAAREAFRAIGAMYDFLAKGFLRNSIDNRGMAIEATVHFGKRYSNACWNGRQMIFGDGDGWLFGRFTGAIDVVSHELTHAMVQHCARLAYAGQSGAVCEHLADAFGMMAKQFTFGHTAAQSDWLIGPGVFGPAVKGRAIRSMLLPGTAYDDPVLGRDPQPAHMDAYVHTVEDNGGVHVNCGILNRAFALAARELRGYTWNVLGRIWYRVLTGKLGTSTTFRSFARDTVNAAGELYGRAGSVQRTVAEAWEAVGLPVPVPSRSRVSLSVNQNNNNPLSRRTTR